LNAQAVINAERARLLFEVERSDLGPGFLSFTIYAKNYGRTSTEVFGVIGPEFVVVNNPYDLPIPIPSRPIFLPTKRYVAPNDRIPVAVFNPRSSVLEQRAIRLMNETGRDAVQHRMAYGEVRYRDGVSDDLRHSRYCLRFEREAPSNIGESLVPDGPPEYNECT
jgi:hypothetical protein